MGAFPVPAVVAKVNSESIDETVSLVATLESIDVIEVVSELDSTVKDILFSEGDRVEQGRLLLRLDDIATRARLKEATAAYGMAKLSYNRNRRLLDNDTISQQEFDEADTTFQDSSAALALARDQQNKTRIVAAFSGVVGEREVSVGQFVTRSQRLTELVRLDPLDVVFNVPERYLSKLRHDLTAVFVPDALADETFIGRVTYIASQVDPQSRTVRVKASLSNEDGKLRPGLFGRLSLAVGHQDGALMIPESCVRFSSHGTTVIGIDAEGKAVFTSVQLGQRFKGRVEIVDGLTAGDLVVVEGGQKMGPGSPVIATAESSAFGVTPGPLGVSNADVESVPGA